MTRRLRSATAAFIALFAILNASCGGDIPRPTIPTEHPVLAVQKSLTRDLNGNLYTGTFETNAQSILKEVASDENYWNWILQTALGDHYEDVSETLRQRIVSNDFSWMPNIELVPASSMGDAMGAYAPYKNRVFMRNDIASSPAATLVYLEEVGHFLDRWLRDTDAEGDEGGLFRRLVMGEGLMPDEVALYREWNDHGTLTVNGQIYEVEFILGSVASFFKKLVSTTGDIATFSWKSFKTVGVGLKEAAKGTWRGATTLAGWVKIGADFAADRMEKALKGSFVQSFRNLVALKNIIMGLGYDFGEGFAMVGMGLEEISRGDIKGGVGHFFAGMAKLALEAPADVWLTTNMEIVTALQTSLGIEVPGRSLTASEKDRLSLVYRQAVDLDAVVVKSGFCGVWMLNPRPFTMENTILMKELPFETDSTFHTLVHEMLHVWQFQNGGTDYKGVQIPGLGHDIAALAAARATTR